jgi:hypothetical protein
MIKFGCIREDACSPILQQLKMVQYRITNTIEERVAVIQTEHNMTIDQVIASVTVKIFSDFPNLKKSSVDRLKYLLYMMFK